MSPESNLNENNEESSKQWLENLQKSIRNQDSHNKKAKIYILVFVLSVIISSFQIPIISTYLSFIMGGYAIVKLMGYFKW